jgi:hypothetical protein
MGGDGGVIVPTRGVCVCVPQIIITLTVVFFLIGVAFRSVLAPLRSVCTISLTLGVVYGLAILVYQDGALDWLGWRPLGQVGNIAWLPIVMCFSIIIGLVRPRPSRSRGDSPDWL